MMTSLTVFLMVLFHTEPIAGSLRILVHNHLMAAL